MNDDLPWNRLHGTSPITSGTRLLGPELGQLLPQRLFNRPLDHRPSRIDGDLLQGIEVEIKTWPFIPKRRFPRPGK